MRGVKPFGFFLVLCLLGSGCAHHHHHHHDQEGSLRLDDLPPNVRDHFDRDHPDATIRDISEQTQGGVTHYTIRFEEQGVSREIQYDRDGVEMRPDVKLP